MVFYGIESQINSNDYSINDDLKSRKYTINENHIFICEYGGQCYSKNLDKNIFDSNAIVLNNQKDTLIAYNLKDTILFKLYSILIIHFGIDV